MRKKKELLRIKNLSLPINSFTGNKIKELRMKKGWTMEKLAIESMEEYPDSNGKTRFIPMSKATIEAYENCKTSPTIKRLECICTALGTTLAKFFK